MTEEDPPYWLKKRKIHILPWRQAGGNASAGLPSVRSETTSASGRTGGLEGEEGTWGKKRHSPNASLKESQLSVDQKRVTGWRSRGKEEL